MSLAKQLDIDIVTAMKARDSKTTTTLRGLKADLKNFQISAGSRDKEMGDEQVIQVLSSAAKRRKDSIEQYSNAGRADLADIEKAELAIIEKYLPELMSAEDVSKVVSETVAELGLDSMQQIGKLMQALMPKLKGKADGKMINSLAREILAQQNSNG